MPWIGLSRENRVNIVAFPEREESFSYVGYSSPSMPPPTRLDPILLSNDPPLKRIMLQNPRHRCDIRGKQVKWLIHLQDGSYALTDDNQLYRSLLCSICAVQSLSCLLAIVLIYLMHCKTMTMSVQNAICPLQVKRPWTSITMDSRWPWTRHRLYLVSALVFHRCLEMNVLASCGSWFRCPLCSLTYCDANLMSMHINKTHRDVLKNNQRTNAQRRSNSRQVQVHSSSRSSTASEHHRLRKLSWLRRFRSFWFVLRPTHFLNIVESVTCLHRNSLKQSCARVDYSFADWLTEWLTSSVAWFGCTIDGQLKLSIKGHLCVAEL